MQKASLPKGSRDFAPDVLKKRLEIIDSISAVYQRYGFEPLETPAMENLSTLTGKYGDEGDKLLFKVLNSGDYLSKVTDDQLIDAKENSNTILNLISEKGLRYDLTIPFARFVVQNRHAIQFPFKRYQIQPVWRADRPQKGRYREFWQCDADVIGTQSLLCEADFIKIYHEVFNSLGLTNYKVKINHRKILEAIAISVEFTGHLTDLTVAIDKLDKIGWTGVGNELLLRGMTDNQIKKLQSLLTTENLTTETLNNLEQKLVPSEQAKTGIQELRDVIELLGQSIENYRVELDLSLARGLDYYTGCIFEAMVENATVGSVSGGGRYDDLTGVFGLPDVSGVGISFGIDRLYDIMHEEGLLTNDNAPNAQILLCHFDAESRKACIAVASILRENKIACEVYPDIKNIRKQLDYANKRSYRFTGVIGESEMNSESVQFKDMISGDQANLSHADLIKRLK